MSQQKRIVAIAIVAIGLSAPAKAEAQEPTLAKPVSTYYADGDFRPAPPSNHTFDTISQEELTAPVPEADPDAVTHPEDVEAGRCPECERHAAAAAEADGTCACQAPAGEGDCDCHCDCDCDCKGGWLGKHGRKCRKMLECIEEDPRYLLGRMNQCDWFVNGWVNGGYTINDESDASRYNGPVTFNDRNEEFQMNQLYAVMGKEANNDGCGFAIGGRVDFYYGTDSRFTESRGLELRQNGDYHWNGQRFYGISLPQAYAEAAYNDFRVKVGHYYTIVGYEVVPAPDNFFYSHAYTMQYGEPFTHTGVLASWDMNDCITVLGGFDRGWDNWEDDEDDQLSFLGGVTYDNGCGLSLGVSGTAGKDPVTFGVNDNTERLLLSTVVSWQMNDRATIVVQNDNGWQNDGSFDRQSDAEWYGINSYFYYKLNCCWTAGARFEWFRDDDGTRVKAVGDRQSTGTAEYLASGGTVVPNNPASVGGFAGNFYEISAGLNYTPNSNLIIRQEIRLDYFDGTNIFSPNLQPFGDGNSDDQVTAAIDLILRF